MHPRPMADTSRSASFRCFMRIPAFRNKGSSVAFTQDRTSSTGPPEERSGRGGRPGLDRPAKVAQCSLEFGRAERDFHDAVDAAVVQSALDHRGGLTLDQLIRRAVTVV